MTPLGWYDNIIHIGGRTACPDTKESVMRPRMSDWRLLRLAERCRFWLWTGTGLMAGSYLGVALGPDGLLGAVS